jgi:transcriptional regulator with XRE-family HTH domain
MLHLTQKQLADLVVVPIRTVQGWEQGRHRPHSVARRAVLNKLESLLPHLDSTRHKRLKPTSEEED